MRDTHSPEGGENVAILEKLPTFDELYSQNKFKSQKLKTVNDLEEIGILNIHMWTQTDSNIKLNYEKIKLSGLLKL